MQIAKFDETTRRLSEAQALIVELESMKREYATSMQTMEDREKNIHEIAKKIDKLVESNQVRESHFEERIQLKKRLDEQLKEFADIEKSTDSRIELRNELFKTQEEKEKKEKEEEKEVEKAFQRLRVVQEDLREYEEDDEEQEEKHKQILVDIDTYKKYESVYLTESGTALPNFEEFKSKDYPSTTTAEEAEDLKLNAIMKGVEDYRHLEEEFKREADEEERHNLEVLKDVEKRQEGRDDNQNEILDAARQELDKLEGAIDEESKADYN